MGLKYMIVVLLHLEVWHMIVLVAEPLHKLVYLGALDGLGAGEGVEAGVLGLVGGQQQHQLGARVGEAANRTEMNTTHSFDIKEAVSSVSPSPLCLGDDVAELCGVQLTLGQQGVAQRDDRPAEDQQHEITPAHSITQQLSDLLLISVLTVLERIMARCGLQSPHRVSPHCFIAVGILNIEQFYIIPLTEGAFNATQ